MKLSSSKSLFTRERGDGGGDYRKYIDPELILTFRGRAMQQDNFNKEDGGGQVCIGGGRRKRKATKTKRTKRKKRAELKKGDVALHIHYSCPITAESAVHVKQNTCDPMLKLTEGLR